MKKTFSSLLFVTLLSLVFISCEDDPSPVGAPLLPGNDKFKFDTLNTLIDPINQTSTMYTQELDIGAATRVYLGKMEGVESSLLLRFLTLIPDSVLNEIKKDSINVLQSWMLLYPQYFLGEENSAFDFQINEIQEDWLPSKFNVDSLANLTVGDEDLLISKELTDTLFRVDVNNTVVNKWVQNADDSATANFGVVLKPSAGTNKIQAFEGISSSAKNLPVLKVVVEKPGKFIDTLDLPINSDVHVADIEMPDTTDNNFIVLQGGLSTRGRLKFDLEGVIPNNASANFARLELTIDTLNSNLLNGFSESISYSIAADSSSNSIATAFGTLALAKEGGKYVDNNFVQFLNRWLNGIDNHGIILNITNEIASLSNIKLYGSEAELSLRPKLIVTYSY